MIVYTTANQIDPSFFANAAVLVTKPGEAPSLQWIVDSSLHQDELAAFQQDVMFGRGTLVQHDPAKGAPKGFTELRVAISEVPVELIQQLPRRLRVSVVSKLEAA